MLYNLKLLAPNHYAMAKFDADFNVAAVYNLVPKGNGFSCDCPAGQRAVKLKPCKHQKMLRVMAGAVNTDRFYDPENGQWHMPLAQVVGPIEPTANPTATEIAQMDLDPNGHFAKADAAILEPVLDSVAKLASAGEGPGPSPLAVKTPSSPSASGRGQPATPLVTRRI